MQKTEDIVRSREFDGLLAQFGGLINKVCYFYATDVDDFNDLRQEAMLNIWRGLERYRGEANISTWIYRITLNSCVSYFRKTKRHKGSDAIENHPEIISDDDDKARMISEMYSLINRLDSIDKAVILMWLDGNDYVSIGDVVGLNKTTVGTRVHRIKEKLIKLSND